MPHSTTGRDFDRDRPFRRWIPSTSLQAWKQEVNDLVENLIGDPLAPFRGDVPRLDIAESTDAIEVTVDLPGYKREEIQLEVDEQSLILKGSRQVESSSPSSDLKYHRIERRDGEFSRTVWLPCPVRQDNIQAVLSNGVLKIRLPKTRESTRKKVDIQEVVNTDPPVS